MNKNNGITLLEMLIALLIAIVIGMAGMGIYLTGWRVYQDGQRQAQAQRNAQIAMSLITKQITENCVSNFVLTEPPHEKIIQFQSQRNTGSLPNDLIDPYRIDITFSRDPNDLAHYHKIYCVSSFPPNTNLWTANHILDCDFQVSSLDHENCTLIVTITGTDNNETQRPDNSYIYEHTITTKITPRYVAVPTPIDGVNG